MSVIKMIRTGQPATSDIKKDGLTFICSMRAFS